MLNCLIPWINVSVAKETRYKQKCSGYCQKLILRIAEFNFPPTHTAKQLDCNVEGLK